MHPFKDTSNSTGSFHSQQTSQTPLKTRRQPPRKKYKLASCMWCFSFLQKVIQKMLSLPLHPWNLWNITHSLQFSAATVVWAEPCCCSQKLQCLWCTGDEGRLGQHGELQENRNVLEWEGSKAELPFPAYRKVSINLPRFPPLHVVENEVWRELRQNPIEGNGG